MKTPLNELLDWIKEFEDKPVPPTLTNMKEKIWQLLPNEKVQIKGAFRSGVNVDMYFDPSSELSESENYFKQTYE
jgi:hypothetical protein